MIVVNDKRTPETIKYDFNDNASQRTVERVIQLLSEPLLAAVLEHGAPITIDVHMSHHDFPAGNEIYFVKPDFGGEEADVIFNTKFAEFILGKGHVAVFRDWINGILYLREVTNVTGTEDAA